MADEPEAETMSGARARGAAPLSPGPRSEPRAAPGPHSSQRGLASVGQAPSSLHSSAAPGRSSLLFILCYGQAKAFLSIQVGRVPRLEGPRRFPEQQSCPVAAQLQTPKRAGRAAGTAGAEGKELGQEEPPEANVRFLQLLHRGQALIPAPR